MTTPPSKFKLSSRDVARHRNLPQLETLAETEARNLARIDALFDRAPEIAATLAACERGARCGRIICAVCARRFSSCAAKSSPEHVNVYDFVDPQVGRATPYGVYDITPKRLGQRRNQF